MTTGRRQGKYGNRTGTINTPSTLMAQTFALAQVDGIYIKDICDNDPNTIGNWRRGDHHPDLLKAEKIIHSLGYEIIVRRKSE